MTGTELEDLVMRTWKMEVGGHRKIGRPKLRRSDVIRKYSKKKGAKIYGRSIRLENMEIENLMRRSQKGKRPKNKKMTGTE